MGSSGFPGGTGGKDSTCQCRRLKRHSFDPWVGTILWSRNRQTAPVFLPGKFHGQRSLEGYGSRGCRLCMTEHSGKQRWSPGSPAWGSVMREARVGGRLKREYVDMQCWSTVTQQKLRQQCKAIILQKFFFKSKGKKKETHPQLPRGIAESEPFYLLLYRFSCFSKLFSNHGRVFLWCLESYPVSSKTAETKTSLSSTDARQPHAKSRILAKFWKTFLSIYL